ncbi:putative hydroxypyruvate isomerase [Onthophagus taurus]|uniref:putative hydroxypyruvate isomerase n=1 Tax=Onthophagus taurus TaxID=166361 RepID=UPI0039BDBFEB
MAKFCANLSFMFVESSFLERYNLAKKAGFKAVESGYPFGIKQEDVIRAKNDSGIQQVLLNVYTGDVSKGELGFAAIPGKENEFKDSMEKTIQLARNLDVKKVHVMSGKVESPSMENDEVYIKNLKLASDMLQKENILAVIEPINNYSIPNYYMNCYNKALNTVKKVGNPNLKIMLDIFHMQHIRGNLSNTIKDLLEHTGHIQIAQVPNRNEPNTDGEINYKYLLKLIQELGYNDWIGLEYKPTDLTFKWIQEYGYQL